MKLNQSLSLWYPGGRLTPGHWPIGVRGALQHESHVCTRERRTARTGFRVKAAVRDSLRREAEKHIYGDLRMTVERIDRFRRAHPDVQRQVLAELQMQAETREPGARAPAAATLVVVVGTSIAVVAAFLSALLGGLNLAGLWVHKGARVVKRRVAAGAWRRPCSLSRCRSVLSSLPPSSSPPSLKVRASL